MPPAGLPRDPAQWLALAVAVVTLAAGHRILRPWIARRRLFVAAASASALALSAAYVLVYLRGGARIIDATSYFLEARALAQGSLRWPLDAPSTSMLGRFLVRSDGPDGPHVAVIFPPGYPAVLALGFLAGAPLAVGPLLAVGIVVATYDLAARVAPDTDDPTRVSVPQLAALFSVTCAALRYHTADTMSHGLAALCTTAALALTLRAVDAAGAPGRAFALASGAGLAAGWLVATRPVSGMALAVVLALALVERGSAPARTRVRLACGIVAGAIPGCLLLAAHQRASAGAIGLSPQHLYYAVSDGPTGCFRYGFGVGVGCVGEHGDFVRARLAQGYSALAAAGTTLRRLKLHLVDPLNLEPLALLVPLGAIARWKTPRARLLAIAVLVQIAAYVPFYFDGNYPGGGARFFADVLPFEHVLAAMAVAALAARRASPHRWAASAIALGLTGFAVRAGFDHAALRDRDGALPMFEPHRLAEAGIHDGLVFFDTDHGYNLALDPKASACRAASSGGFEAARFHGDDLDRMTWEARGRPPAYRYRFMFQHTGSGRVIIEPLLLTKITAAPLAIEGESLWPPLAQEGGYALVEPASGGCASASRWLALHADTAASLATARIELPARWAGGRAVALRLAYAPDVRGEVLLAVDGAIRRAWTIPDTTAGGSESDQPRCIDLEGADVPAGAGRAEIVLRRGPSPLGGVIALDRITLGAQKND